jgi:hypothetical protein
MTVARVREPASVAESVVGLASVADTLRNLEIDVVAGMFEAAIFESCTVISMS